MSYLVQMLTSSRKPVMILASAFLVLTLFLLFPVHPAEAAPMTFTSDTTITATEAVINADETWTINPGVTLTVGPSARVWNDGTIVNNGKIRVLDRIINFANIQNNAGAIMSTEDSGIISNYGTIANEGTVNIFSSLLLQNEGTFDNNGKLNIISHLTFGEMTNDGTFNNNGIIDSNGTIKNFLNGIITNAGDIIVKCGSTFVNYGAFSGNPVHNECIYDFNLFERGVPSDGVLNLHQPLIVKARTNDLNLDQVRFSWFVPGCTIDACKQFTELVPLSPIGEAEARFIPREGGHWIAEADFYSGSVIKQAISKGFDVSFSVIPESPIGPIALVVSSFAALGAYMKFRTKV